MASSNRPVINHKKELAKSMLLLEGSCTVRGCLSLVRGKKITIEYKGNQPMSAGTATQVATSAIHFPIKMVGDTADAIPQSLSSLLAACDNSPFGHGSETVYNESVRKAKQIPPERITKVVSFDPATCGILEKVRNALVPNAGNINATLHKLNVYGPGDHFSAHQDTPRDRHCFGTLIVCLPSPFKGGELDIEGRIFDFGKKLREVEQLLTSSATAGTSSTAATTSSSTERPLPLGTPLQWVAFFGDCKHSISPVQQGYRITLTYILRHVDDTVSTSVPMVVAATGAGTSSSSSSSSSEYSQYIVEHLKNICRSKGLPVSGNKSALVDRLLVAQQQEQEQQPPSTSTSAGTGSSNGGQPTSAPLTVSPCLNEEAVAKGKVMFNALRAALLDSKFCEDGGLLGFPCLHMYEDDNELPPQDESGELTVAGQNLRLKGADAILYIAAARLGLKPRVVRIASNDECDDKIFLRRWPSLEDARNWTLIEFIECSFPARALTLESFNDLGVVVDFEQHGGSCYFPDDGIKWIKYPTKSDGKYFAMKSRVLECQFSGTGYFGNDSCQACFYAEAAVVLQIPPAARRRQAVHGAASAPPPPPVIMSAAATTASAASNPTADSASVHVKKKLKPSPAPELASASTTTAAEDEVNMLRIPENIDLTCFQGIQKGRSSREESAWDRTRFGNFQRGPGLAEFTLSELEGIADQMGVSSDGTKYDLINRIEWEMEKREEGEWVGSWAHGEMPWKYNSEYESDNYSP
mmetsp:Transcript_428/g.746  ORF Transcript_428/g.746 Transcript_428/m.746 type:complete len:753 (+) Transcript_428:182-2440(+)